MKKTVIIVDDHSLFAKSLKIMVESFKEYSVLETLKNGQELVDYFQANQKKPDIVMLDIKMPVMNGMETMSWLRKNAPEQKVLALSMEDDETTVISMMKLGIRGYLLKDIDPKEFRVAIESVLEEGFYHSELQMKSLNSDIKGTSEKFSEMEIQFLKLVCSDLTYTEISDILGRSYKTIDGYREILFRKLNVRSRTGLAMYAIKHNLVTI